MLYSSGIGIYLQELLNYLKNIEGVHCLIREEDDVFFTIRDIPFTIFNESIYSIREQLNYPFKLPKADIFWSPHYNTPILPIRCKKRVVTIHDVYHLTDVGQINLKQKIYANLLMQNSIRRSNQIITVSEFSKNEIIRHTGCKADKISVIHNGVAEINTIADLPNKKYNIPEKYLLFVGNVKPHKNLIVLCQAFLKLPNNLQDELKIVIVGKKEGFITGDIQLLDLINNEPMLQENVIFTGYVEDEDMNAIYQKAMIFIFPSLYEGFGLPPLEAMLNSTPVICSDIPPLKEICDDAVLYFDPKNSDDLVTKIIHMNDHNIAEKYVLLGNNRAKEFTWKKSFDKHLEVFNL